jgi:hypothetical protein
MAEMLTVASVSIVSSFKCNAQPSKNRTASFGRRSEAPDRKIFYRSQPQLAVHITRLYYCAIDNRGYVCPNVLGKKALRDVDSVVEVILRFHLAKNVQTEKYCSIRCNATHECRACDPYC